MPFAPTTRSAPLPVFRAAVFAVVGTVLGVSAHHLIAGGPAPWRPAVAAAVLLFAVGLAGGRRPRSLAAVVVTCAAAQSGLHVWLSAAHSRHTPAMTMPAHAHHAMTAHGTWPERLHDSAAMTVLHAVTAVFIAVLLQRADAACWSLARGLNGAVDAIRARIATVRALLEGLPVPSGRGSRVRRPRRAESPLCTGALLADVVVRRGPPSAWLAPAV